MCPVGWDVSTRGHTGTLGQHSHNRAHHLLTKPALLLPHLRKWAPPIFSVARTRTWNSLPIVTWRALWRSTWTWQVSSWLSPWFAGAPQHWALFQFPERGLLLPPRALGLPWSRALGCLCLDFSPPSAFSLATPTHLSGSSMCHFLQEVFPDHQLRSGQGSHVSVKTLLHHCTWHNPLRGDLSTSVSPTSLQTPPHPSCFSASLVPGPVSGTY